MRLNKNFLSQSDLAKPIIVMFAATTFANFFNYLYNLVVGRMLGPGDFGIFTSMLSIILIFMGLATSLQLVITRYVAILSSQNRYSSIKKYFIRSLKLYGVVGFLCFGLIMVLSFLIKDFLKVPSIFPIMAAALFIAISMVSSSPMGVLQGIQSFGKYSVSVIVPPVFRFDFGILFIYFGWGVAGAVGSSAVGGMAALVLLLIFVFKSIHGSKYQQNSDPDIKGESALKFSIYVLVSTFLLLAIINSDMLFAKHYFSSVEAGIYGSVVTLGKIVLYMPMAVSIVLMPKTSEIGKINSRSGRILLKSIAITIFLCLLVVLIYFLAPNFLVKLIFGSNFLKAIPYISYYGLAMVFISVLQVFSTYFISVYSRILIPMLGATLFAQVFLFNLFTRSLMEYVFIMLAIGLLTCAFSISYVVFMLMRERHISIRTYK